MEERLYDTVEAAAFLELSRETVNLLALKGKLPSQKFGRARLIRETDLIAFKAIDRKPGRPPKSKGEPASEIGAAETAAEGTGKTDGQAITPATEPIKAKRKRTAKKATSQSVKRMRS